MLAEPESRWKGLMAWSPQRSALACQDPLMGSLAHCTLRAKMEAFSQSDVNAISSSKLRPKWSHPKPAMLNITLSGLHFSCSTIYYCLKMKMNIRTHTVTVDSDIGQEIVARNMFNYICSYMDIKQAVLPE